MQCEVLNGTWDEAEEAGAAIRKPNVLCRADSSRDCLTRGNCPVVTEDAAITGNGSNTALSISTSPTLLYVQEFPLFFDLLTFFGVALQCCVTFCCTANRVSSAYTYFPFSFGFPSHLGHHRAWSRVPYAVQQVLLSFSISYTMGVPAGSVGKESACNLQETQVRSLGREDALEEGMATHSSILA